jgi:hypothetical protein
MTKPQVDWKSMTPQEVLVALQSAPQVAVRQGRDWFGYGVSCSKMGFTHDEPIGEEEYLQQNGYLTINAVR